MKNYGNVKEVIGDVFDSSHPSKETQDTFKDAYWKLLDYIGVEVERKNIKYLKKEPQKQDRKNHEFLGQTFFNKKMTLHVELWHAMLYGQ